MRYLKEMKLIFNFVLIAFIKYSYCTPAQIAIGKALDVYIPTLLNISQKDWFEIEKNFTSPETAIFKTRRRNYSFPGTKWCGPGNTAKYFDDLGFDKETDICCRKHDYCPLSIDPGQTKCGFKNNYEFKR